MSSKTKHATVKIGEFTVPLIGIPESATLERCDRCKKLFNIIQVTLTFGGQLLCGPCLNASK